MNGEMDPRLEEALGAAQASPDDDARWDALEDLAASLQRPDEVGQLYRDTLARGLAPDVAERLSRRAVGFHEEWFGESSTQLVDVLLTVLANDPSNEQALQRVTVLLTVKERWTELLGLFDKALDAAKDEWRRTQLLEEASQLAKDFAQQPDRAIDYQKRLLAIRPDDAQLIASLERLMERQARWTELIELWRSRLDGGPRDRAIRERVATTFLERVGDPASALAEARSLIADGIGEEHALSIAERVLVLGTAPADVRSDALALLRERYEQAGRAADVERIVALALDFAVGDEKATLYRDLAERAEARGDDSGAIGHWAALLVLDPGASDAAQHLAQLAARTGAHERHADALVAAAEAAYEPARRMELLIEAGDVRAASIGDRDGAEQLYRRVLESPDASLDARKGVARRLVDLLDVEGRGLDRLATFERLAELEADPSERRRALGQGARLALALGDADRSLALWQRRLDADPQDLEALDARIAIFEREERWEPLVATLRVRADGPVPPLMRRADLARIAAVQEGALASPAAAIDTWLQIAREYGEDVQVVDALSRLFEGERRFEEKAGLLERATARDADRAADIVVRLADLRRGPLGDLGRAAQGYHLALKLDPAHQGARAGLGALIEVEDARAAAVEGLAEAAMATGDHAALLGLLEHRLAAAGTARAKIRLLREAATLEEQKNGDAKAALRATVRAFALAPEDEALELEVLRLSEAASDAAPAIDAFRGALGERSLDASRVAHLHRRIAALEDERAGDRAGARAHALAALRIEPRDLATARDVVRLAALVSPLEAAAMAEALVCTARAHRRIDEPLLASVEDAAGHANAWSALAAATASRIAAEVASITDGGRAGTLREQGYAELGRLLETRVAVWHRDRLGDLESAENALSRALAHDPGHTETLRELARLQWRSPGRPLIDTLLALAERLTDDLDALYDAARIAIDPVGDTVLAKDILAKLLREATRLWERGGSVHGERPADATARWALDELVRLELAAERWSFAVDMLVAGARLPVAPEESRAMRRRAGDIAREQLADEARAMRLYQSIVDETLEDSATVDRLASMYEARGRVPELLALRQRELGLELPPERRLAVRLEIARLLGHLEEKGGRIDMLRQNLTDAPGHDASIAEVATVLEAKGKSAELAELLSTQARRVEEPDAARASRLWAMVARLAEERLGDPERAINAHRRVVALAPTPEAWEALARLHMARGEAAPASEALEKRLETLRGTERTPFAMRLADARIAAGRTDRAIVALERALTDDPDAREVREKLAGLYRSTEAWEPLAKLLSDGVARVSDDVTQLAYVREAADIYRRRLDRPDLAIPILARGVELVPDDQELRFTLAEGLRVAGELDRAREILEKLVADFGRRRSPERAAAHYALARVAHQGGQLKEALDQLDKASSMDLNHPGILRMLGELSREAGQLDRSERAYRALLLLVRRQSPEAEDLPVGPSEVLFELSRLATERKQDAQAKELLETAFEAARQSAPEARRFTRVLVARGATELALRTIEMRLGSESTPLGKARILADRADILDRLQGRPEEALAARLEALELAPDWKEQHEAARELAKRTSASPRYAQLLNTLVDRVRRKEDAPLASDLVLRAGEVAEKDMGDLAAAAEAYTRLEQLKVRQLDAWRALARVARARNDHVEEIRVLRRLLSAGVDTSALAEDGDAIPEGAKTDAFYRIAEVEITAEETLESGLTTLDDALSRDSDHARAARIAALGAASFPDHEGVLALWEKAARGTGDERALLGYLEHRVGRESASLDHVREAVDVAARIEAAGDAAAGTRVEAILRRGVEVAKSSLDGLAGSLWIPVSLSDRRAAAGDVAGAMQWRKVAAEAAEAAGDGARATELWMEVAKLAAGPGGDPRLAAETWSRLVEADPGRRELWADMTAAWAKLGDREGFEGVVRRALDGLLDPAARNDLRMHLAGFLLDVARAEQDAIAVLRDVMEEDPDHLAAAQKLADIYERNGENEALAELLGRQLDRARDKSDVVAVAALTLRMGGLLERSRPRDAMDLYRSGLDWAPEDAALLRALLGLYGPDDDAHDRAAIAERLLAVEKGDGAASLAIELADMYGFLEDGDGIGRALSLGFRAAPQSSTLRTRLEAWHRDRGDWAGLAEMIALDAASRREPTEAVARYREAARIHLERLDRPEEAIEALRAARALAPKDLGLLGELVGALGACSRHDEGVAELSAALEAEADDAATRAHLLRLRGAMYVALSDTASAVRDLEEAYALAPAETAGDLANALDHHRLARRSDGDHEAERAATLRLSDVLAASGDAARSRDVLAEWSERDPRDATALRALRDLDTASARWSDVATHAARLIEIETGEAQVDAALRLLEAAQKAGTAEVARAGLERVYSEQPAEPRVRDALRSMYESSRAFEELAQILLADAEAAASADVRFDALRRVGELYAYEIQDPARAIEPLRAALTLRDDDADVIVILSDAMIGASQLAEAVEVLQVAINSSKRKRSPHLAMMQQRMGRIAGLSGDPQTQLEWLKVALDSDKGNGAVAAELAELAMQLGDDTTAMNALKVVTLQKTPGPMSKAVAFLRQAQIAHRAGDHQKALLWARRARIEDAELREAEEFLVQIGEG